MTEKPNPAYRIHTPRLVLRCWEPADAPGQKTAVDASRDYLKPWMPWAWTDPDPLSAVIERIRSFRGNFDLGYEFVYGVFNREESLVLGGCGLHPRVGDEGIEIGYWIHVEHGGRGLGTECGAALTRLAFEVHHLDRVEIHCEPANHASAAIARKLGFTHEATLRRRTVFTEDDLRDSMIWTLFAPDYPNSPAAKIQIEAFDVTGNQIL